MIILLLQEIYNRKLMYINYIYICIYMYKQEDIKDRKTLLQKMEDKGHIQ